MSLLHFVLCAYGIAYTLVSSKLTYGLRHRLSLHTNSVSRFFTTMLSCIFCTGFYAGIVACIIVWPSILSLDIYCVARLLSFGFVGAASSYLLDILALRLEK